MPSQAPLSKRSCPGTLQHTSLSQRPQPKVTSPWRPPVHHWTPFEGGSHRAPPPTKTTLCVLISQAEVRNRDGKTILWSKNPLHKSWVPPSSQFCPTGLCSMQGRVMLMVCSMHYLLLVAVNYQHWSPSLPWRRHHLHLKSNSKWIFSLLPPVKPWATLRKLHMFLRD